MTTTPDLDRVFSAVADPTRRAILDRLSRGPATAGELAAPFRISQPAVSRHLKVLERAGLLERRIQGRVHHCHACLQPLQAAEAWMSDRRAFWDRQLSALRAFVEDTDAS